MVGVRETKRSQARWKRFFCSNKGYSFTACCQQNYSTSALSKYLAKDVDKKKVPIFSRQTNLVLTVYFPIMSLGKNNDWTLTTDTAA